MLEVKFINLNVLLYLVQVQCLLYFEISHNGSQNKDLLLQFYNQKKNLMICNEDVNSSNILADNFYVGKIYLWS